MGCSGLGPRQEGPWHTPPASVRVLNFPRTADPEQLYLTSSGLLEAVGCMQPRLGTEAWDHE